MKCPAKIFFTISFLLTFCSILINANEDEIPIPFDDTEPDLPIDHEIFNCGSHVKIMMKQMMESYSNFRNNQTKSNIDIIQINTIIGQSERIVEKSRSRLRTYHQRLQSLHWHHFDLRFRWLVGINQCEHIETLVSWIGAILLGHRERLFLHLDQESNYHHLEMINNQDYFPEFIHVGKKIEKLLQISLDRKDSIQQDLIHLKRDVLGQMKESLMKLLNIQHLFLDYNRKRLAIEEFALVEVRVKFIDELEKFLKEFNDHLEQI